MKVCVPAQSKNSGGVMPLTLEWMGFDLDRFVAEIKPKSPHQSEIDGLIEFTTLSRAWTNKLAAASSHLSALQTYDNLPPLQAVIDELDPVRAFLYSNIGHWEEEFAAAKDRARGNYPMALVDSIDVALDAAIALHNAISEFVDRLKTVDALRSPATGKTYSNIDDMFADIAGV